MNLDHVISGEISVKHAACLSANLPLGSATLAKIDRRLSFTNADWMLLAIVNRLSDKPIDPFKDDGKQELTAMDIDELAAYLARPREDVS